MTPLSTTHIGRNQWWFYSCLHVGGSERRLQSNNGFNEIDIEFVSILKKSLRGHLGLAEWLNAIILCSDSFRIASPPAAWDSLCTVGFMVLNGCSSSSRYSHLSVSTNDKEETKGTSLCLKEYFLGVAHRVLLLVHQLVTQLKRHLGNVVLIPGGHMSNEKSDIVWLRKKGKT